MYPATRTHSTVTEGVEGVGEDEGGDEGVEVAGLVAQHEVDGPGDGLRGGADGRAFLCVGRT